MFVSSGTQTSFPPPLKSIEERIELAASCRDCDDLPKVPDAGRVQTEPDGRRVQIMHNGLKVLADGYYGEWMTRLISLCRGHHEPQEERVFDHAARLLPRDASMIELGGFWCYYSAWFLQGAPGRRAVILEPDPAHLRMGEHTLELNGLTAAFVAGAAGEAPAPPAPFTTESSGTLLRSTFSVPQLMEMHGIDRLDLLHCDVQGAELNVLQGCRDLFRAGRLGLVFVSTHAAAISGDPLLHHRCLELLRACGGVIEAEHDVYESYSGDGLIVARFGPAPEGWHTVPLSHARRRDVLFRDPLFDLAETTSAPGRAARESIEQLVDELYRAVLFRPADPEGRALFADEVERTGEVGGVLRSLMGSPEFAAHSGRFRREYLAGSAGDDSSPVAPLPSGSPFACAALHLSLQRDTPLGRKGDGLVLPSDQIMMPFVLANGCWSPEILDFFRSRVAAERRYTLVDIGANSGLFTRQLLRACPNVVACHCVEPAPLNYEALRLNLATFPDVAIRTYPIALGASDGEATFFRDLGNAGNYSLHADAMRDRPFTQFSVTVLAAGPWLETNLAGSAPLLWKSDTQGNDVPILAATPPSVWSRVEIAVIELWRLRRESSIAAEFLRRVADMPNRLLGSQPVSVEEVAAYLEGDDWAHDDLYLWRD